MYFHFFRYVVVVLILEHKKNKKLNEENRCDEDDVNGIDTDDDPINCQNFSI